MMIRLVTWLALMVSVCSAHGMAAATIPINRAPHSSATVLHESTKSKGRPHPSVPSKARGTDRVWDGEAQSSQPSKEKTLEGAKGEQKGGQKGDEGQETTDKEKPGQPEKKDPLEHAASDVSAIRSIIADSLLVAVLASFLGALILEMRRKTVVIDPIEVPKEIAERGYTPQVVAQRLAAEITALRREARMKGRLEEGYELSSAQPDFTVPAAGISYRSIVRYARQLFRRPEQLVQGEIVRDTPHAQDAAETEDTAEVLHMALRTRERHTIPKLGVVSDHELPSLLRKAAFELAVIADPYLVANYWFALDQREGKLDFERTIAAARRCLARTEAKEHYRAYVGWGNALVVKRDFAAAEEKLATALRLRPRSALTFNSLGNLKRVTRRYDQAAEMYLRAKRLDRRQSQVWSNLGNVGNDRRRYRDALSRFGRAIRLDPNFAAAWSGRGYALWKLGRSVDSEASFARAIDLDPNYGWSYLSWARLLQSQGRDEEAIAKLD